MTTLTSTRLIVKIAGLALFTLVAACGEGAIEEDESTPDPIADEVEATGEEAEEYASTSSALTSTELNQLRDQMLAAVNKARATARTCGTKSYKAAPPLRRDSRLDNAAQGHTTEMANKNYFSHTGLNGSSPFDRMKAAGYRYRTAGENIAAGYADVARTMQQWIKSPGHCQNIMNPAYVHLGIGFAQNSSSQYKNYWTQNFGAPQ
jgi:uncharacterized protein YkwD